mgnify:CR=1 FL=1
MADDFNGQLAQVRVGIAGLGGLGSHIAVFLARAGVQHLHLVDFDRVDESNLNRQHYFLRDVGRLKTEALAEQLLAINPALKIKNLRQQTPPLFLKQTALSAKRWTSLKPKPCW